MSLDAMKQALEVLESVVAAHGYNSGTPINAITALRAAIEQAQGLAEKIPAKGTLLEQTLKDVWDEMPHTALMDAIIGGTGVMLGNKRIDPASIYKQPEQDPRRWEDQETCHCDSPTWCKHYNKCNRKMLGLPPAPRQWQGLTDEDVKSIWRDIDGSEGMLMRFARAIEAKLKEKNT